MKSIDLPKLKAAQIISKLGLRDHKDIVRHLTEICAHQGAMIKYSELEDCEGRLVVNGDKGVITVKDSEDYPGRTRFSIAHELGHFELHRKQNQSWSCSSFDLENRFKSESVKDLEEEANSFASELLLPSKFFKPMAMDVTPELNKIEQLIEEFETSLTATLCRYTEVTQHAVAVVFFKGGRLWFQRISSPMRDMRFWAAPGKLNKGTVASSMSSANNDSNGFQDVFIDAWMPEPGIYLRNTKLQEHSMFFRNLDFGLSILWALS